MNTTIIIASILTFLGLISFFYFAVNYNKAMSHIEYIFVGNKDELLRLTVKMCISVIFMGTGIGLYFSCLLN